MSSLNFESIDFEDHSNFVKFLKAKMVEAMLEYNLCTPGHFGIQYLGDLKESPSLGESSHVMFSGMAKYSSLIAFYTFSEQQPKAIEDKVCLHQS